MRKTAYESGSFQDTDHYRTTVRFLQNPESAVEDILGRQSSEKKAGAVDTRKAEQDFNATLELLKGICKPVK